MLIYLTVCAIILSVEQQHPLAPGKGQAMYEQPELPFPSVGGLHTEPPRSACPPVQTDAGSSFKTCKICGVSYTLDHFLSSNGKPLSRCRQCESERHRAYRDYHLEERSIKAKEYYAANKDRILANNRAWRSANGNRRRVYTNEYRAANPSVRVAQSLRGRLHQALNGASKSASLRKLIGCSFKELKAHLESQFHIGMTWDNYGNPNGDHTDCWHIDHIIPCAAFDLTNPVEQKQCMHYSNLQPLWAKENLIKGSKFEAAERAAIHSTEGCSDVWT